MSILRKLKGWQLIALILLSTLVALWIVILTAPSSILKLEPLDPGEEINAQWIAWKSVHHPAHPGMTWGPSRDHTWRAGPHGPVVTLEQTVWYKGSKVGRQMGLFRQDKSGTSQWSPLLHAEIPFGTTLVGEELWLAYGLPRDTLHLTQIDGATLQPVVDFTWPDSSEPKRLIGIEVADSFALDERRLGVLFHGVDDRRERTWHLLLFDTTSPGIRVIPLPEELIVDGFDPDSNLLFLRPPKARPRMARALDLDTGTEATDVSELREFNRYFGPAIRLTPMRSHHAEASLIFQLPAAGMTIRHEGSIDRLFSTREQPTLDPMDDLVWPALKMLLIRATSRSDEEAFFRLQRFGEVVVHSGDSTYALEGEIATLAKSARVDVAYYPLNDHQALVRAAYLNTPFGTDVSTLRLGVIEAGSPQVTWIGWTEMPETTRLHDIEFMSDGVTLFIATHTLDEYKRLSGLYSLEWPNTNAIDLLPTGVLRLAPSDFIR